jgi:cytochrome c553
MRGPLTIGRLTWLRDLDLRAALLALLLTAAGSVVVSGDESIVAVKASGSVEAKLNYCKTCHGLSAQGYRGYFPMPRLAGQQPQYIENQLRAFIERRRTNPIMANVAHALNPSMIAVLASYLHQLESRPIGGAPRGTMVLGKRIYEEGLPESNVAACWACHGAAAKGQNEIPRLAGQLYEYTVGQLAGWATQRGQGTAVDTSAIMAPTAHNLTRSQVEAVAAYVSTLQ